MSLIIGDNGYSLDDLVGDVLMVTDEEGNEINYSELPAEIQTQLAENLRTELGRFVKQGRRRRRKLRQAKNGDMSIRQAAEETGLSEDTIVRIFDKEPGVIKRTFTGRNRKKYTVRRIPKAVFDRVRQKQGAQIGN